MNFSASAGASSLQRLSREASRMASSKHHPALGWPHLGASNINKITMKFIVC